MTITEIALLSLPSGVTSINADLRAKLANAKKVMQDFAGRTFYYLQQCEDPSHIYIIGEWESLDQHMNDFIPSEANQALLESLKDELSVVWLLHIDTQHADLPLPKTDVTSAETFPVLSIGRHFVKNGAKEGFRESHESNRRYLQDYLTEGNMGGGWRVDKEDGKDEWVLLCPFINVQQDLDFANTDDFEKYWRMRVHIDSAEIKHAKILDI
jgi:quinol monooxygenase YgiN